ncbi:MAG TPA: hypothetical protein VGF77_03395 [Allosphingosinicella sp.]|jgi:hypothetical protein
MQRVTAILLVSAFAATPALAQTGFNGTWKVDLHSVQAPQKPDVFMIKGGIYSCRSCVPVVTVKADGAFHAVTGHPYYDEESVKVVDARTVAFANRLRGKATGSSTDTVSADGRTLTFTFTDTSSPNGQVVNGRGTERRVGPAPAGAHAISGSWRTDKYDNVSQAGLLTTYKLAGGMLEMSSPTGQSYRAKIGGGPVAIHGDSAGTMASIRRLGPATLQETDRRAGKIVSVATMTLDRGGRTMNVVYEDKVGGMRTLYKQVKQ